MKRIRDFINNSDINRFRFYLQLAAFVLFVYGGYFYINISEKLPTFACPYNNGSAGTCYLMPLQHQIHMPWGRFIGSRGLHFLTGFLTFVGLFLLFNKAWCGYICPLGTIQDWLTKIRKYLHIRFSIYDETTFKNLNKIKYILLFLLIIITLGASNSLMGLPKFSHDIFPPFCKICPGRVVLPLFTGDITQLYIDFSTKTAMVMTALGLMFTGVFLVGSFFKKRFFCLFCPMSALHYIFSKAAILRLNKDGSKCTRCGNCYMVCDVRIKEIADDITSKNIVQDDCMMCFKCVAACPEEGCLNVNLLGASVYQSTEEGFFKRMKRKEKGGI